VGVQSQIDRLEREMDPPSKQTNAPMPGALQEIVAKQFANEGEDLGIGSRMEPVAAVVHSQAGEFETTGIASYTVRLLDNGDVVSVARESYRGAEPRGARPKNYNLCHAITTRIPFVDELIRLDS
jgi:hypothetical protein